MAEVLLHPDLGAGSAVAPLAFEMGVVTRVLVPTSARRPCTSLVVFSGRDNVKMPRVHASTVKARLAARTLSCGKGSVMADVVSVHPLRNNDSPVVEKRPMGDLQLPPVMANLRCVTALSKRPRPQPAVSALIDFGKEPRLCVHAANITTWRRFNG